MLLSMTGFGKATCQLAGKKIIVEIKSLNSKQLDLNMKVANPYRFKEIDIRNFIAQHLTRGKVDFCLTQEAAGGEASVQQINRAAFKAYYDQLIALRKDCHDLDNDHHLYSTILRMPEVLKQDSSDVTDEEWARVQPCVVEAIENLVAFRTQEGAALQRMFGEKLDHIAALLEEVEQYEGERVRKIRATIEDGLQKLAEESKIEINQNRLEQEMIFYIEKLDVNEEKVRLRNHLKYFRETMEETEPVGKKLGFIAQEMGREINTLGSKSNNSEMQILVVRMKDELEQIKEQVLNVL